MSSRQVTEGKVRVEEARRTEEKFIITRDPKTGVRNGKECKEVPITRTSGF